MRVGTTSRSAPSQVTATCGNALSLSTHAEHFCKPLKSNTIDISKFL